MSVCAAPLLGAPLLTVLLPVFNEEESLASVVLGYAKLCAQSEVEHEILVVDDGSVDNTASLLSLLKRENNNLRVHSLSKRLGKGAAIREGALQAQGRYILLGGVNESLRSFSQAPEGALLRALQLLQGGYDVVVSEPPSAEDSNLRGMGAALLLRLKKGIGGFLGSQTGAPLLFIERLRAIELCAGLKNSATSAELLSLAREQRHRLAEVVHPSFKR